MVTTAIATWKSAWTTARRSVLVGDLDGKTGELLNTTFAPNDKFKLVKLIPGDDREQIVCEGSAYLPQGQGGLDTYTLFRIEGDRLQELMSVITQRDREEGNGPPHKS